MGDEAFYEQLRARLDPAYLSATTPEGGSGFGGDSARWEIARRPVAEAIDRDGTFCDVGCANGLLMESVVRWAGERGLSVAPYGVDLSPAIAARARVRLQAWADRIWVGNAIDWIPPRRFDFVYTLPLDFVPPARCRDLVARLMDLFAEPDGRVILGAYGSRSRRKDAAPVAQVVREMGFAVRGEAEARERIEDSDGEVVISRVAWIDAPLRWLP